MGFKERANLQEWIAKEPSCLGEELLVIQKEFSGFSDTHERLESISRGLESLSELSSSSPGAGVERWSAHLRRLRDNFRTIQEELETTAGFRILKRAFLRSQFRWHAQRQRFYSGLLREAGFW